MEISSNKNKQIVQDCIDRVEKNNGNKLSKIDFIITVMNEYNKAIFDYKLSLITDEEAEAFGKAWERYH
jgi:hypothetical protein